MTNPVVLHTANPASASDAFFTYTRKGSKLTIAQVDANVENVAKTFALLTVAQIPDVDITALSSTHILVRGAGSTWVNVPISGDASMSAAGALTVSKIGAKAITLANSFTTTGNYALTIAVPQAQTITFPNAASATLLANTLTSAYVFVGSAGGLATGVAITGDITITNAGLTAIAAGVIIDADIRSDAAIVLTKLAATTATRVLVSDGNGLITVSATTPTELLYLNTVAAGTVQANKAVVAGATSNVSALTIGGLVIATNTITTLAGADLTLDTNGAGVINIESNIENASSVVWTAYADVIIRGETGIDIVLDGSATSVIMIATKAVVPVGFFGIYSHVQASALTTALTTLTFVAPITPDYAIQGVESAQYGFKTADEGNTVLSVVANLQVRVNQLETLLANYGLIYKP